MNKPIRVATLNNEIEAQLLSAMLDEEGITHLLRTYHDAAYDGLFQSPTAWGHVEAPAECREEILTIIEDLKEEELEDEHPAD